MKVAILSTSSARDLTWNEAGNTPVASEPSERLLELEAQGYRMLIVTTRQKEDLSEWDQCAVERCEAVFYAHWKGDGALLDPALLGPWFRALAHVGLSLPVDTPHWMAARQWATDQGIVTH